MGSRKKTCQPNLGNQLLPVLLKQSSVIGDTIAVDGRYWDSCPTADKDKWFTCIVREFDALHSFPGGFKSGWPDKR